MTTLAFDTHAAIKKLQAAGFTESQAETQIAVLSDIIGSETATRQDLKNTENTLQQNLKSMESALRQDMRVSEERTEGRFKLLQWMLGFNLALTLAVLFLLLRH